MEDMVFGPNEPPHEYGIEAETRLSTNMAVYSYRLKYSLATFVDHAFLGKATWLETCAKALENINQNHAEDFFSQARDEFQKNLREGEYFL